MQNLLSAPVKQRMAASGGVAAVSLLEVLTLGGTLYGWADVAITAPSILASAYSGNPPGGFHPQTSAALIGEDKPRQPTGMIPTLDFLPWILTPPVFTEYKSTQTATATIAIQNLTGDSVRRDVTGIAKANELNGALVFFRIWRMDAETPIFAFQGNIDSARLEPGGPALSLSVEGSYAWAKVAAPREQLGPACSNIFNNNGAFFACGSTSSTPCTNSYGTCSSLQRFKGVLTEWVGSTLNDIQYAQQSPLRLYNPRTKN